MAETTWEDLESYVGHPIVASDEYKRSILSLMNYDYKKVWENHKVDFQGIRKYQTKKTTERKNITKLKKQQQVEYYQINEDAIRQQQTIYCENNKDAILEQMATYYKNNKNAKRYYFGTCDIAYGSKKILNYHLDTLKHLYTYLNSVG